MRSRLYIRSVLLIVMGLFVLTTYQNCADVKFELDEQASKLDYCTDHPNELNCLPVPSPVCQFNGGTVPDGTTITAYRDGGVAYGESCVSESRLCVGGALSGSYQYATCQVGTPKNCLFNGTTIEHGQATTAFQNPSVSFGANCQSEQRVCRNGVLSGTFNYGTCSPQAPASCLFNGQEIPHGGSVAAYLNRNVPFGGVCQQENRLCHNGALSGTYTQGTCEIAQPLSCTFNGKIVAHGQTVTGFQNSTVPYGQSCRSEERTCDNGNLLGSYSYSSCQANQPRTCLFNGASVAHGEKVTAYQNSTVPFGQSCQSQVRTCEDGSLSGSYNFPSCAPALPQSCSFNGRVVNHGESVQAYVSSSVPFGSTCVPTTRTCTDGNLSGSGDFPSCAVAQPASCEFNGTAVAHGQVVVAYQNSSVPFGGSCVTQSRICDNGSLSGSFMYGVCEVGAPLSCRFNGVDIAHGQRVSAYKNSAVVFGNTCEGELRECSNGQLSGSYNYGSCTVGAPKNCRFNGSDVPHGGTVGAYLSSSVPFGQVCEQQQRTCWDGSLSGTYAFGSCEPAAPRSCLFNGETIPHGGLVVAYQSSSVPFGGSCSSIQRTCQDGTLTGDEAYASASCVVGAPASCDFQGVQYAHGEVVRRWLAAKVPAGSSCSDEQRVCQNGKMLGSYLESSCQVEAPPASFGISAQASVNEGSSASFEIRGTGIPNGSTFDFSLRGTGITESDFDARSTSGVATFQNNVAVVSLPIRADLTTEGNETLTFQLWSKDKSVAVEAQILIIDTSLTPGATISGAATLSEGISSVYTIESADIADGKYVNLCVRSGSQGPYLDQNLDLLCRAGVFFHGRVDIQIQPVADQYTEGTEYGVLYATLDGILLAEKSISVLDTSLDPVVQITGPASIDEGVASNFSLVVTGAVNGYPIYYSFESSQVSGHTNSSDWVDPSGYSRASGSVAISGSSPNGTGLIQAQPGADLKTEGVELSSLVIQGSRGQILATKSFSVNDTSKNVSALLTGPLVINEGVASTFTFNASGLNSNVIFYYYLDTSGGAGRTDHQDWYDQSLNSRSSGSFMTSGGNGSFSIQPFADLRTEGQETTTIRIETSEGITVAALDIKVQDTSILPTGSLTGPSSVSEGVSSSFNLSVSGVPDGAILVYYLDSTGGVGRTDSQDWKDANMYVRNSGTVMVTGGVAQIAVVPTADLYTEGTESSLLTIKNQVGDAITTKSFVVNDTSILPTGTITGPSSLNEGSTEIYTVQVSGGSVKVQWVLSGDAYSFKGTYGTPTGMLYLSPDQASLALTPLADLRTEGPKTYNLIILTEFGAEIVRKTITVNDTSLSPTFGSVGSAQTRYVEGMNATFSVSTQNVPDGTLIPYTLSGAGISSTDVVGGALSGQLRVQGGQASLTIQIALDGVVEGDEMLTFTLTPAGANPLTKSVTISDP